MHRLRLSASGAALNSMPAEDLLWRPIGQASSVDTTLGPRLEDLGHVPNLNIDFVRLAALVFFCDRTVERPWTLRRDFELEIAVSDPDSWSRQAGRLSALLSLLTGDAWALHFARRRQPRLGEVASLPAHDVALLFSGGSDSACGAIAAHGEGLRPLAASHSDWKATAGSQGRVLAALSKETGNSLDQIYWRFGRIEKQVGSEADFSSEPTRRSRSLLFLAMGAAISGASGKPLWIAENGFTSLNPPLVPESAGALSTRTTHPAFLRGMVEVLADLGVQLELNNRFVELTKGEMFAEVKETLGGDRAADVLGATHSCGKPPQGVKGIAPAMHCGLCYGCLVRRSAFLTSGLADSTLYADQKVAKSRRKRYLSPKRMATYSALQYRLEVGFGEEDVLDLGLPDDANLDGALDLIQRGLTELATVKIE